MKNVYWLAKENIAILKSESLHDLVDCQFQNAKCDKDVSVQYRTHSSSWEMIEAMSKIIEDSGIEEIRKSEYISIMVDESTDISISKNLMLFIKFLKRDSFVPETKFVKLLQLNDGTAKTIYTELKAFLKRKDLKFSNIIGWGSDGASVMMGGKGGVQALMRKDCPKLIGIHDLGHAENLAAVHAYKQVSYLTTVDTILKCIHKYVSFSTKRINKLNNVQIELELPEVKMKRLYEIRFLSKSEVVASVVRCLPALLSVLRDDELDPSASGIYQKLTELKFLLHLHFICDVLNTLAILNKFLQKKNLHPQTAYPRIQATIVLLKDSFIDGSVFSNNDICKSFSAFWAQMKNHPVLFHGHVIKYTTEDESIFEKNIKIYITHLCGNLSLRFGDASINEVLKAAKIFDPSTYPNKASDLLHFGHNEVRVLANHFSTYANSTTGEELTNKNVTMLDNPDSDIESNVGDENILYRIDPTIALTDDESGLNLTDANGTNCSEVNVDECLLEYPHFRHFIFINHRCNNLIDICTLLQRPSYKEQYPNLSKIAAAILVIPSGSIDCERGFSQQNIIKSKSRNKLEIKHLNCLMQIRIEGPSLYLFDWHKAFTVWKNMTMKKPRRAIQNPKRHLQSVSVVLPKRIKKLRHKNIQKVRDRFTLSKKP